MIKTKLPAVISLSALLLAALLPTESFATLNDIACHAIRQGCYSNCTHGDEACFKQCADAWFDCIEPVTKRGQTPPPPCTGIHCTVGNPHPPTTLGPPTRKPRPVKPVKPVGVSNPNKTNTGDSGPVILLRKNDSGGQGHGH
jgi:hypothetical protein